jgi:hypothetical protein
MNVARRSRRYGVLEIAIKAIATMQPDQQQTFDGHAGDERHRAHHRHQDTHRTEVALDAGDDDTKCDDRVRQRLKRRGGVRDAAERIRSLSIPASQIRMANFRNSTDWNEKLPNEIQRCAGYAGLTGMSSVTSVTMPAAISSGLYSCRHLSSGTWQ